MILPDSMLWVPLFVESMQWALMGDIYSWNLEPQADPLRRVLHLRLQRRWRKEEIPLLRAILSEWCRVNDCVYRKSLWKHRDFRALIMLKGLGPKKEINPFLLEKPNAHRRNR